MWFLRTLYQRESLGKIWGIRQMDQWRSILDPNRQPLLTITSFTVKQVRSMPWEHWIRRYTNKFVLCQKSSSTLAISTNHRFILKFTLPLLFYTRRGAQKNWMHWKVSVFLFCFVLRLIRLFEEPISKKNLPFKSNASKIFSLGSFSWFKQTVV